MTDAELRRMFEDRSLPLDQWTHRAHVRIAWMYIRTCADFEEACARMRSGVQRYNERNRVPESPTSGYHETTTIAFMHIIRAVDAAYCEAMPTPDSEAFCHTHAQLLNKHILRLFYSPDRRMLPQAKTHFIEPDLAPLPACPPLAG